MAQAAEDFYTYEGRLASFQTIPKRRPSSAKGKSTKSLKWPHKFLSAEQLASAGFFYQPSLESNDNVTCYLCSKSILGWEKGDVPLAEHLKLSPDCGWAIVASIENDETLVNENPASERMTSARRATFADRWPHEQKKGWKCKTKQLVDAGWIYKPAPDYDDMAMCSYCNLGLDGWEPKDDPMDQHHKRNPDCAFFTLINQHWAEPTKKKAAGRKARSSKVSRLSSQSNLTVNHDAPSYADITAEEDDSILTTATNTTISSQAGRKMPKTGRKPAVKKTRPKKNEPVEVERMESEDDSLEVKVQESTKPARGRKRTSEVVEDSSALTISEPAAKRQATRTRGSIAMADTIVVDVGDTINADVTVEESVDPAVTSKAGRRGRPSKAKISRSASTASKASLRMHVPDDNELEDALLADLDRPLSIDGDEITVSMSKVKIHDKTHAVPNQEQTAASVAPVRKTRISKITKADHAMFGTREFEMDDVVIEAELDRIQNEQSKPLPKAKSAKTKQTRKPSAKQHAATKRAAELTEEEGNEMQAKSHADPYQQIEPAIESQSTDRSSSPARPKRSRKAGTNASPQQPKVPGLDVSIRAVEGDNVFDVEDVHTEMSHDIEGPGNVSEDSLTSQSSILRPQKITKNPKGSKKTRSKKMEEEIHSPNVLVANGDLIPERQASLAALESPEVADHRYEDITDDEDVRSLAQVSDTEDTARSAIRIPSPRLEHEEINYENQPIYEDQQDLQRSTPTAVGSATPEPKENTPALSPQSSDAENHPPSSKASITKPAQNISRVPLAASTPTASPSKRNIVAGLQSLLPWSAIELENVFLKSPGASAENGQHTTSFLENVVNKVKKGELTSPEKGMTVEQWIQFNAGLAEENLKGECERMVSVFEREGGRAMRVLEEIRCLE